MYFTPTEHKYMIVMRTRLLRMRLNWKPRDMAQALRLPLTTYRNYEYRSVIPSINQMAFCKIVGISIGNFLSPEFTETDIELFKWHDENKNCRLLRDDIRPNFVNGKLAPVGMQGEE